uniref:Uncharacterized protein n=1 Tax=Ditylum brightwellii TaxID=49249 RepID=A0A7S4SDI4_9STRA|mmetsp:Transcript_6162/g.8068  ORF Transcript_6162/g.8068 Transcript_6162/m.8068 type:complete len:462 (+) Transcript_6162:40-1425(+)
MTSSSSPPTTTTESIHPIVFVPALMASELERQTKGKNGKDPPEKVYITPSIGLGLSTPSIALPITWTDATSNDDDDDQSCSLKQDKDDIVPVEVLNKIELKCCCSSIPIIDQYSTFTKYFEDEYGEDVFYTFPYDWRRDLNESTDLLLEFLQEVKQKHNGKAAQVISHSMGCLIALAAYHANHELFHSALFCGAMFGGGFGFYPTNTEGWPIGLNKAYIGPKVAHTFPSLYAGASPMNVWKDPILRSSDGRQLWQFVDSKDTEKTIDIDMWNINDWKKYKIGPWCLEEEVSKEMETHVENCLTAGFYFQRKMRNLDTNLNSLAYEERDIENNKSITATNDPLPPVATLVGDQFLHPSYFLWDTEKSKMIEWTPALIKKYNPKHMDITDGTVSHVSASQPPGLPKGKKVFEYKAKNNGPGKGVHRDLMDEVQLIHTILKDMCQVVNNAGVSTSADIVRHARV